ncbi:MAG: hypothetical protein CVU57_29780 [Deltaproteobacteria bacterium HGW-Deltaproteobacteria-15]|jgi:DNA repair exonuclease SbcCD ATPase subunit|nr:MAG: hypothetical protein CVU57_29780 [Deltaproteobacteria bacterium HGW-Deltaproteobacteria-15]
MNLYLRSALLICAFVLTSSDSYAFLDKIVKKAYEAQKQVIRDAQESIEKSTKQVAKDINKTGVAEKKVAEAAEAAKLASEKENQIAELSKKNAALSSALKKATQDLEQAKTDLNTAKSDLQNVKDELEGYRKVFSILEEKNESASDKADWLGSGFLFSLIANFLAILTFCISRPKQKVELKKIEIETEIAMIQLQSLKHGMADHSDVTASQGKVKGDDFKVAKGLLET